MEGAEVVVYFEATSVITVLVLLGQLPEAIARGQTGQIILSILGSAATASAWHKFGRRRRAVGK